MGGFSGGNLAVQLERGEEDWGDEQITGVGPGRLHSGPLLNFICLRMTAATKRTALMLRAMKQNL